MCKFSVYEQSFIACVNDVFMSDFFGIFLGSNDPFCVKTCKPNFFQMFANYYLNEKKILEFSVSPYKINKKQFTSS